VQTGDFSLTDLRRSPIGCHAPKNGCATALDPAAHRNFHTFFDHARCRSLGILNDVAFHSERPVREPGITAAPAKKCRA
jgi:hypothetical protein